MNVRFCLLSSLSSPQPSLMQFSFLRFFSTARNSTHDSSAGGVSAE
jgi:hypothetical protein